MNSLIDYLNANKIAFTSNENTFIISGKTYIHIDRSPCFTDEFILMADPVECDFYIFYFGGRWYFTPVGSEQSVQFNELKYIGKSTSEISLPFLGVHGCYEILNGSREYKDWVKKAKFLGIDTLGICEKNTLAGTFKFQQTCKDAGIKPVIGVTYTIYRVKEDIKYDLKIYAENQNGWANLLKLNKLASETGNLIPESKFLSLIDGLIIIIDTKSLKFENVFPLNLHVNFYALDTVHFENENRDKDYLLNLQKYIQSEFKPVLLTDAYYLDSEDYVAKIILNEVSGVRDPESKNQYFKSAEDILTELGYLFQNSDTMYGLLQKAVENLLSVAEACQFSIPTGEKHLPKYIMNESEKKDFESNEDLFWHYIQEGMTEKAAFEDQYLQSIEKEYEIIDHGHLQDYFLINRDQVQWAKDNGIMVGIGRGSAPSFVTTWLMGITGIDPIKYKLIPERFLTKHRAKASLPDIDIDFAQDRRDDVKLFLKQKYGDNQCCNVGTYGSFQIKGAITDIGKFFEVEYGTLKMITKIIPNQVKTMSELFNFIKESDTFKKFIIENPKIFYVLPLILHSMRSKSVHASAYIITPDTKKVYDWIPVRKEGDEYVSEWEGNELDYFGLLKNDILGLTQLSKFDYIIRHIEEKTGKTIDLQSIPLNDKTVYKYFANGWNQDTFQFGTSGLSKYCQDLKPESINDLIAAVALYRPGTMDNNFHKEYILLKEGKKQPEYFWGTEEILKDTYGLPIYQEDIMHIFQKLGGFDAAMSDDARRAMGKKKLDVMEKLKTEFVTNVTAKGCPEHEANGIWEMMLKFTGYAFNASHSTSYAITGYWSQWLKVNYPIYFWACAIHFTQNDPKGDLKIPLYLSEIHNTGDIFISPVSISKSKADVFVDYEKKAIYWPLNSIKQIAEKSSQQIISDTNENGEYFSFEDFYSRNKFKGSKVTKQVYENLILAGAFDEVESIKEIQDRNRLISLYRKLDKPKVEKSKDIFEINKTKLSQNWWWVLMQKNLSGIAFFNWPEIVREVETNAYPYMDAESIKKPENAQRNITIGGYVVDFVQKSGKKGEYVRITVETNYVYNEIMIWPDDFKRLKKAFEVSEKCLILFAGRIMSDKRRDQNVIFSTNESDVLILC